MNEMTTAHLHTEEAAGRLQRLVQALVRRFAVAERAEISCCGTTVAQAAALAALSLGGPTRAGDLGRRLGIDASTLSRNLDRLEARGLVTRVSDSGDARVRFVELTAPGRDAAAAVAEQEEAFARSILDHLPYGEETIVLTALERLLDAVRAATADCCPGVYDHLFIRKEDGRES
jgi:DNA-binding MarR family transcriptional regulator